MESLFPLLATDWILVGSSSKSFITTVPRPSSPVEYRELLHYSGYVTPTWKRHHFMSTWIAQKKVSTQRMWRPGLEV